MKGEQLRGAWVRVMTENGIELNATDFIAMRKLLTEGHDWDKSDRFKEGLVAGT